MVHEKFAELFRLAGLRFVFALTVALTAAASAVSAGPADAQTVDTQVALHDALVSRPSDQSSDTPTVPASLLAFYTERNFAPAWTGSPEAEAMGRQVLAVLARAGEQGLRDADYAATATHWNDPPGAGPEAAAYELSLTADLLRYASDVCLGRVYPRDVYKDVNLPARRFDVAQALELALKDRAIDAFLAGLPPPHPEYRGLVAALARYRDIAKQGGWPAVPAKSEIATDGKDPRLHPLVARLAMEDPVLANVADPTGDDVRDAISRYQSRNGIEPDGRAGPDTLATLNKPVSQRIAQIVANLERWRWLPHSFERRYIAVNVPDQTVLFVNDGNVLLSSRAIVGRQNSRTPILLMMATDVVANPPWNVPDDLAAGLLPHLRGNPNYLASRHMVLMDGPSDDQQGTKIDWRKMKSLPYQVQQAPGPDSAMGVLMLDSPNAFGVYLHDTPGKTLFDAEMRQKSNGCIRVEQMFPLASLALSGDTGEGLDRIGGAVATGQTQRLALDNPLPVYLLYWTAVADPDGMVGFRNDFYGRDKPLLAAMDKARPPANPG